MGRLVGQFALLFKLFVRHSVIDACRVVPVYTDEMTVDDIAGGG